MSGETFSRRDALKRHLKNHNRGGTSPPDQPSTSNMPPPPPPPHPGMPADEALRIAFNNLRCRAKIHISCGLMLCHTMTGELRYFHSSSNNARFVDEPFAIGSREDSERMLEALNKEDVEEFGRCRWPETKWVLEMMTNNTIIVNKLRNFPIGAPVRDLSPYVANNQGLVKLVRSRRTGQRFTDNLCFFRCLVLHINNDSHHSLERDTKHLLETYRQATNDPEGAASDFG